MNFDIIIGNPPFQDEVINLQKKGPRKSGKNKLYERITIKCITLLNKNGYLLFITPDNIMTGNTNKAYQDLIKYNILYINLNNIQKKYFSSIGQPMCYFLIQKSEKKINQKTKIINNNSQEINIIIKDKAINPVRNWNTLTEKIFSEYISVNKNNAIYFRGTTESDYTSGKHSVIYLPNRKNIYLKTNNEKLAPGLGIKKIVLFETVPASDGIIDYKGEYGVGPHTIYIPFQTNSEGKILETFFKSQIYKQLVDSSQTSHRYLKVSLISHLNLNKILLKKKIAKVITLSLEKESTLKSKTPTKDKKERAKTKTTQKFTKAKGHKKDNKTKKRGNNKTKKIFSYFKLW